MTPASKSLLAGVILTLLPVLGVYQARQSAWGTFIATPKARQKGDAKAPVLLVEYSDFQCPMCARIQPVLHKFLERYEGKVRMAFKHFPLTRIHRNALPAARAAECAGDQEKFWPYHDQLFETQQQWSSLSDPTTSYVAIAQSIQLDLAAFGKCYADTTRNAIIEQDMKEGQARQINSTPTLFVGDIRLVGPIIESDGARMIERELRK